MTHERDATELGEASEGELISSNEFASTSVFHPKKTLAFGWRTATDEEGPRLGERDPQACV
jgi:hypothetical protein